MLRAAWTVFALVAVTQDVVAQELRVRIADLRQQTLVVGALATLKDSSGATRAQGISNEIGRVRLTAPAGSYRLVIERPGYNDTTHLVEVPAGLDSLVVPHANGRPVFPTRLLALPAACQAPGLTAPAQSLWIEADRALRVVVAGEDQGLLALSIAAFERRLGTDLEVDAEQVNTVLGPANRSGATRLAADLFQQGLAARGDSLQWSAPDAGTFLDPAFLAAHCFGVSAGSEGRDGLLGLSFTPAGSAVAGMAGTFWFDPATRELKVIDYTAVALPKSWRIDRPVGGSLEFHRFEPGFWVTRFWFQRTPNVTLGREVGKDKVASIRERGAEVTGLTVVVDTTDRIATALAIRQQQEASRLRVARMAGRVLDTLGAPVPDADVGILGTDITGTTRRDGTFTLEGLPLGVQIARVRKIGYRVGYQAVRLVGGEEWTGKITVKRAPQILGEIVVVGKYGKPAKYANTAKYDEFYRRRNSKVGKFLTREDIDARQATKITQLLTGIPRLRVGFDRPFGDELEIMGCQGQPSIWIDGQRMNGTTQELLRVISATDVEAMEVYVREIDIPAEFREGTCGAIVMWTR